MAFNLFGTSKKKSPQATPVEATTPTTTPVVVTHAEGTNVLRSFYVSEKASRIGSNDQYVFVVSPEANKQEIKKQVSKRYGVTVTDVRVLNMPAKRRDSGRHPGMRTGFRKAIVRVAKGQSIAQATP